MRKYIRKMFVLAIMSFLCTNFFFAANILDVKEFIDSQNIRVEDIEIPEIISFMKSPTSNGTGYIFHVPTPIANSFLKNECCPGKRVIEIGAGFSSVPVEAIKNGVSEYVVNDISADHLKVLVKKAMIANPENELTNLKLLHGRVPDVLPKSGEKYDAILADKIMHFLSPEEIIEFIDWAKLSLVENGKIYVTTASMYAEVAQHEVYKAKYLQNLKEGKEIPGHFTDVLSKFKESGAVREKFNIPEQMTFFKKEDLVNFFQRHGFRVTDCCYLKIPVEGEDEWKLIENESYLGIIAEKC